MPGPARSEPIATPRAALVTGRVADAAAAVGRIPMMAADGRRAMVAAAGRRRQAAKTRPRMRIPVQRAANAILVLRATRASRAADVPAETVAVMAAVAVAPGRNRRADPAPFPGNGQPFLAIPQNISAQTIPNRAQANGTHAGLGSPVAFPRRCRPGSDRGWLPGS